MHLGIKVNAFGEYYVKYSTDEMENIFSEYVNARLEDL